MVKPYSYTKKTIDLKPVVELGFRIVDSSGNGIEVVPAFKKENHNSFVILENVKPEDTEGIKAQGSPPDEIQYLNDVEIEAREAFIKAAREKVEALPGIILEQAHKRVQDGDLDGAAEAYILYLNATPDGDTKERSEGRKFLAGEFQHTLGDQLSLLGIIAGQTTTDWQENLSTQPLTRIGKYEITGLLGRGGMGLVYRAFDKHLGREVAIKTITEGFAGDPEMLQRFYREAAKTGMLKHSKYRNGLRFGRAGRFPYIVMEYVAGEALDRMIQSARPLPLVSRLKIIEQVCSALAYAHRNDVIHRDVKPANVIVQPDGVAKLLDFGIARQEKQERGLTRTGNVIGTIHYMAPERLRDRAFDGRSDIFSAGVMLYQLLTGQLPFTGEDFSVVQKLLNEQHPPLSNYLHDYPAALDAILDRSLAKDPDNRYDSADEMAADIYAVADEVKKSQVLEMLSASRIAGEGRGVYQGARASAAGHQAGCAAYQGSAIVGVGAAESGVAASATGQIKELKFQADAALHERQYDVAIGHIEEALRLDPPSSELAEVLESIRQKKQARERIEGYLRQADGARSRGDLEAAQVIIGKALDLDKEDSRVRAAFAAIIQQAEKSARLAKTRQLLEAARSEMGGRRFTAAMKLLSDVEQIDPREPEVISLLKQAKSGQEQEQRRRVVEQLQNEISVATTHEQLTTAAARVNIALERMPNEPSY